MAGPLLCDTDAARKTDLPVDNQQFSVCAIVQSAEMIPMWFMVFAHLDSGLLHQRELGGVHLVTADPVEKHVYFDACTTTFSKGVRKVAADRTGPIDEGFERDGFFGTADCLQHRGEDLVPVQQHVHSIALQDTRTEQCPHRAGELRVFRPVKPRDWVLNILFSTRIGAPRCK